MRSWTLCIVLMFYATETRAHDLWLLPDIKPTVGNELIVLARQGMDFPNSTNALSTDKFSHRIVIGPDNKRTTAKPAGKRNASGLMQITGGKPGTYICAVRTRTKIITLKAPKFNHYLVADGLPHIYSMRAKEGTLDQDEVEQYSKSPKVLLQHGEGGGDPCQVVGLPLEIVPLTNPFKLKVGNTLGVRVLFQGKPLTNAHLGWAHANEGNEPRGTVRTDKLGQALIPLAQSGLITIRLTHMTRPKAKDYEWESFWTTLTFALP